MDAEDQTKEMDYLCENRKDINKHALIYIGEKPFSCKYCDKSFSVRSTLVVHERNHTGEKPFKCKHCGKAFAVSSHCITHERSHTGEKPFKCKHCDKAFSVSSNLATHERTHTGEKPFKCKHCNKSFSVKSSLVKHERIHTGEKPFSCKFCNKFFTSHSGLYQHNKRCTEFVIKEEPSAQSDVLNEFMYSPHNEVHHSVTPSTGNHEMLRQSENICEETVYIEVASNQDVKEEIIQDVKTECFPHENNVFTCDVCQEVFSERVVLFMHKDLNHS